MPAPEVLVAGVLFAALVLYVITGGADFGGGVWDLLAPRERRRDHRALIAKAIGPIWEANHVWLILVIVLLFVCFPRVFAAISIALHIPLTLMLIGVVLRGSSFVFRAYDTQRDEVHARWSLIFSVSSVLTPVLLGICTGAIASGALRFDGTMIQGGFVEPWLRVFPVAIGLFTLSLFAFLAAVYLTCETEDVNLQEAYRVRALGSSAIVVLLAWTSLALAKGSAPQIFAGLTAGPVAYTLQALIATVGLSGFALVWRRRYRAARLLAVAQVTLVMAMWGQAQWPYIVMPGFSLHDSAAPANVLWSVLGTLAAGSVLLVPAYLWLMSIFKAHTMAAR